MSPLSVLRSLKSSLARPRPQNAARRRARSGLTVEALEARIALAADASDPFEIAYIGHVGADDMGPTDVYLAGGSNPISAEEWSTYTPPPDYIKNTTRNPQFDSTEFLTSPDSTTQTTYLTTSDGFTWLFVTVTVSANWPFNPDDYPGATYTSGYEAAALDPMPPPGVIRYSANTKNAISTWFAKNADNQPILRYFIRDSWGNVYIMQASGATDDSQVESNFFSAVLPGGWIEYAGYLKKDLTTIPAYDSQGYAQYNIFRDSADDAFQQITWSHSGIGIAQHIPQMIIWGGPRGGIIRGTPRAGNLIHGGQGNDTIYAVGTIDTIYGDGGRDKAVFRGNRSQYTVTRLTSDGSEVVVKRRGAVRDTHVATLYDVELLQFRDGIVSTAFPARPKAASLCRAIALNCEVPPRKPETSR